MKVVSIILLCVLIASCGQNKDQTDLTSTQILQSESKYEARIRQLVLDINKGDLSAAQREEHIEEISFNIEGYQATSSQTEEQNTESAVNAAKRIFELIKEIKEPTIDDYCKLFIGEKCAQNTLSAFFNELQNTPLDPMSDFFTAQMLLNINMIRGILPEHPTKIVSTPEETKTENLTSNNSSISMKEMKILASKYFSTRLGRYLDQNIEYIDLEKRAKESKLVVSYLFPLLEVIKDDNKYDENVILKYAAFFNHFVVNERSSWNESEALSTIVDSFPFDNISDLSFERNFYQSLIFLLNRRVSRDDKSEKIRNRYDEADYIRIKNVLTLLSHTQTNIAAEEYLDILRDEHFALSDFSDNLVKQGLENMSFLDSKVFPRRLEIARQKTLKAIHNRKSDLVCNFGKQALSEEHKSENYAKKMRYYFEEIECGKIVLSDHDELTAKQMYYGMRNFLLEALKLGRPNDEYLRNIGSINDFFLQEMRDDSDSSNLKMLNEEFNYSLNGPSLLDLSYRDISKKAGIFYSQKGIIIKGQRVRFHPLSIIITPGKSISFQSLSKEPVIVDGAWFDVGGLEPIQAENSLSYLQYLASLELPTQGKKTVCEIEQMEMEHNVSCNKFNRNADAINVNDWEKIKSPQLQPSGSAGSSAGRIDLGGASAQGVFTASGIGGNGGRGAPALPPLSVPYTLYENSCERWHNTKKVKGENIGFKPHLINKHCHNKGTTFTFPSIPEGTRGQEGQRGRLAGKPRKTSAIMSTIFLNDESRRE